jgi:hypothetical protein
MEEARKMREGNKGTGEQDIVSTTACAWHHHLCAVGFVVVVKLWFSHPTRLVRSDWPMARLRLFGILRLRGRCRQHSVPVTDWIRDKPSV